MTDPYSDPSLLWKPMGDEAPLWFNVRSDLYVLSRLNDIEQAP